MVLVLVAELDIGVGGDGGGEMLARFPPHTAQRMVSEGALEEGQRVSFGPR